MTASLISCCPRACNLMGHERSPEEVYLAYLPLAHVFELTTEFIVLSLGVKVGYSSPHTLTDNSTAIMPGKYFLGWYLCDTKFPVKEVCEEMPYLGRI